MRALTLAGLVCLTLGAPRAALAQAQDAPSAADTDALFLSMSKMNLGTISSEEDKKRYLETVQLEKARITRKTLSGVYENAYDLYRQGDYDGARDLTNKILAIDPGYEDAAVLQRATSELRGAKRIRLSEQRLVDDRFDEGMAMYRQGRLVEATEKWDEASKLEPDNLKTRYWLKKARSELADQHFRRGQKAYAQHRLRETLDQWYAALTLDPRYPRLSAAIAKVEAEAREQDINEKLQAALNFYSAGQVGDALKMLDEALEEGPGNLRAQKLQAEIRAEMANQHVAQGRQLYEARKYNEAIAEWKKAVEYGYDAKSSDQLIARAKEQMRREAAMRERAAEQAKEYKEAQAKKAAQEAQAKADAEAKKQQDAAAAAAPSPNNAAPAAATGPSDDDKRGAQQHYLAGVISFQKGDYDKARDEWSLAKHLDPGNSDAQAGLDRIDKIYGGGQ